MSGTDEARLNERLLKLEETLVFSERATDALSEEVREMTRRLAALESRVRLLESRLEDEASDLPD